MLSPAENDRLTQVGPGTPGGALLRRYWQPIAPTAQLSEDPVRKVRVLGEDLVLFKDRRGGYGLIGQRCLHRLVDLQWGIPEEDGLRCPYHGWMYDATGQCVERPMEAPENASKLRLKLPAYPVRELGGLIWTYMGPLPAPELPRWDLFVWPNAIRQIGIIVLDCNWLQSQENAGDPTHSGYLHGALFKYALEKKGEYATRTADAQHTLHNRIKIGIGLKELYANATQHGMEKGIVYSKALGADADRRTQHATVMFPNYVQTNFPGDPRCEFQIRMPIDDTHTYYVCYQVYAAPPGVTAPAQDFIPWYSPPIYDAQGKPILDYTLAQDMIAWWAQGDITDRSRETLGRSDLPVVFLRQQLEEQIRLVEQGRDPMNVFRQPHDMLYGAGAPSGRWTAPDWATRNLKAGEREAYRAMYHKGFVIDDSDRYGPATPLVIELHRRIEEAEIAARASQPQPAATAVQ